MKSCENFSFLAIEWCTDFTGSLEETLRLGTMWASLEVRNAKDLLLVHFLLHQSVELNSYMRILVMENIDNVILAKLEK